MPRWEPNALGRLQEAAIELFSAQGFDRTTVAEIATRAGLTERTFFNHFADKRDVLFGRTSERHRDAVAQGIIDSEADLLPLDAVLRGLQSAAGEVLEDNRAPAVRRRAIIAATPELREREEGKRVALTAAIADALRQRGVEPEQALLLAGAALLVQQTAEARWERPSESLPLHDLLTEALSALRGVLGVAGHAPSDPHLKELMGDTP